MADALVQPAAISHWSALAHHGFTSQLPVMVQASTPRKVITPEMRKGAADQPRGRSVWKALGIEVEYLHIQEDHFFGHQKIWVNSWQQISITDPERTALDLIARPAVFGGIRAAIEILEEGLPRIDVHGLIQYALRYDLGVVIKRLGWLLERFGVTSGEIASLQSYPVTTYYRLDPQARPAGFIIPAGISSITSARSNMPDISQRLHTDARQRGVRQDIVEKDYALSYLIAAIAGTDGLGDQLALKGGTALKKLFYPEFRFSEDLDYSTLRPGQSAGIEETMETAIRRMSGLLYERGPFQVHHEVLVLKQPHPGQQAAYLVHVQFPGQRQALCRLKVEITVDEPLLLPVEERHLLHGFGEDLPVAVNSYTLKEIVAEKLRALLQSHQRLRERGWGASRVCRDYYDLWWILQQEGRMDGVVPDLVDQKCDVRSVSYESPEDFLNPELLTVAKREWNQQLAPFVPNAPSVEQLLADVSPLILTLWD